LIVYLLNIYNKNNNLIKNRKTPAEKTWKKWGVNWTVER